MKKRFFTSLQLLACILFVLPCCSVYGSKDDPFPAGSQLPRSTFPAPDSQETLSYLGLTAMEPYTISQIGAKLVLIEVLKVWCPVCRENAPVMNRLYQVVQNDADLARDVKIIGICTENNKKQADAFRKNFKVAFPLIPDEHYGIGLTVKVSHTPTMVLVTSSGKVLWSHIGEISDFDGLLRELRENLKKL
ncbi:MAG: TlpA disulfide reductase family protein [Syntrophobacteraceae bacterium]